MKKVLISREKSPSLNEFMEDFCKAKYAIYQYSPEEYEKKVRNFYENVQSILFIHNNGNKSNMVTGSFVRRLRKIVLRGNEKQLSNLSFDPSAIQALTHELNHAWNYERKKRIGIVPSPHSISKINKYICINEAINEAETQILLDQDDLGKMSDNIFNGYDELEYTVFRTLCIICNQNGLEFLKDIEGKDINGICSHIASRTGQSIEHTTEFMEKFSSFIYREKRESLKETSALKKANVKNVFNNVINSKKNGEKWTDAIVSGVLNTPDIDLDIINRKPDNAYQRCYELTKGFIEKCNYSSEQKDRCISMLENVQDKINQLRVNQIVESVEGQRVSSEQILTENPNMVSVNHDKRDEYEDFELGMYYIPELLYRKKYSASWEYEEKSGREDPNEEVKNNASSKRNGFTINDIKRAVTKFLNEKSDNQR